MSATSAAPARGFEEAKRAQSEERVQFIWLCWGAALLDVVILSVGFARSGDVAAILDWDVMLWVAALALVGLGLTPVPLGNGPVLAMDLPILLGAAFVFGPLPAGFVAAVGLMDARILRRQISLHRAVFNRAQISLAVMVAALVFEAVGGRVGIWPMAALAAVLALLADFALNYPVTLLATAVRTNRPLREVASAMEFGALSVFLSVYSCLGLLGLLLAEVFERLHGWGLAIAIVPVVLARQVLLHRRKLETANRALLARRLATNQVTEKIVQERRDERLAVAGGLHDEVLPPLFQVHLMGQVIRRDLESGRLLELEADVSDLLEATDVAQGAIRDLIRDLRKSPLGAGGVAATLRLLIRQLESQTRAKFHDEVEDFRASPLAQHLAYQVAGEALRNAAKHARAENISVDIHREGDDIRVTVNDDGRGFDPAALIDPNAHFGLQLMRERLEAFGGILHIDSYPGAGTTVIARVPAERSDVGLWETN